MASSENLIESLDSWFTDYIARDAEALTKAFQKAITGEEPTVSGISGGSDQESAPRPHTGRVSKRKSRASKRSQTTFITADPAKFRKMVQQVTGVRFGGGSSAAKVATAPVLKPEPQRLGRGEGFAGGRLPAAAGCLLPTLDTSAFLLDHHQQQEVGPNSAAAGAGPFPFAQPVGVVDGSPSLGSAEERRASHSIQIRTWLLSVSVKAILAQIQRWLMKSEVWRFVGFASAVVGLLCYALSSTFNHLIGGWNLLKIFLYSVSSLIICIAVLFAKAWQHSASLRFKAHMAFLVLTITSVFSFFLDKRVNRKPDAYSLISCAAFAMMSLSLSRQRQIPCGFEVDLLNFFLGFFIIQLMKIKLLLGIVGAGFSYSLVILHSSLDGLTENAGLGIEDQNHITIQMGSLHSNNGGGALLITNQQANTDSVPIMTSSHAPSPSTSDVTMPGFMHILDEIRQTNPKVVNMLRKSLKKYPAEMGRIPEELTRDHNYAMDALPLNLINDLHENVKLMVAGGFEKKCTDEYSRWRREFLKECLLWFGLNELSSKEADELKRIKNWIKLSGIALRILFPFERTLCDRIFAGFSGVADLSFMQVCSEVMSNILNFANAYAVGSRSPNLLPNILPMLRTLHYLLPEMESVFSDQCSESLRTEAIRTSQRLQETSKHLFMELENLICRDMSQGTSFGGLCPITEEVMQYLSAVAEVVVSPLHSVEVTGIEELLERHLKAKFKDYTNHPAGIFGQKAVGQKLKTILGYYRILRSLTENHKHDERSILEQFIFPPRYDYIMSVCKDHGQARDQEACPICLTNEKDMTFGCGHMTCRDCGSALARCPICRERITTHLRV